MPTHEATPAGAKWARSDPGTAASGGAATPSSRRLWPSWDAASRARTILDALEHLVGGLGTAVLALIALLGVLVAAVTCLVGVGFLLAPAALRVLRAVADRERARLSRWGPEIIGPEPLPARLAPALQDPAVRRESAWMAGHSTLGLALGVVGLTLPLAAVRDISFPLYWRLLPEGEASGQLGLWTVHDWPGAAGVAAMGLGWIVLSAVLIPGMARLQAWLGRRFLSPDPGTDLALRVAQLTATRAAALDAHAAELRRIERSLHDGTQNRLVAVNVMLGAARRALARNPADAEAMIDRAQDAAEQALAELRTVVRSILPPVLADRSLADALTGLAAACPVPCRVDADVPDRCAASVEATAYFVVAEALTNIAKHSHAQHATVTLNRRDDQLHLKITDDGRGGAHELAGSWPDDADSQQQGSPRIADAEAVPRRTSGSNRSGRSAGLGAGSGLGGIHRRVEAHDGTLTLTSPPGGPTTLTVSLPCGL